MKRNNFVWFAVLAVVLSACQPVQPEPGTTLSGTIAMGDKAETANLTLKVSDDGKAIVSARVDFTQITCESFSGGSMTSQNEGLNAPITDGQFEIKSSSIGEISGKFTASTAAQGTIHLLFKPGFGGEIECGTWEWSTK